MDEIIEFINRRFNNDIVRSCFMNGNCYWFAYILVERFPQLKIYYEPIDGHFVAGNGCRFYDICGLVDSAVTFILLEEIKSKDALWYQHLMRDCKM